MTEPKVMIWDVEPYYQVEMHPCGKVKVRSNSKHAKGRYLTPQYLQGYRRFKMNNQYIHAHKLVTQEYLGNRPKGYTVNHIDGDKKNNHISNLEYITRADNIRHAVKLGLHVAADPKRNGRYKHGKTLDKNKYKREWYRKNKHKNKEYYEKNKERIAIRRKEYYERTGK